MSIKRFLIISSVTNTILLFLILTIFVVSKEKFLSKTNEMINYDMKILLNFNELFSLGLRSGQATRNILLNP